MGFHGVQSDAATSGGVRYRTCVFAPHDATPPHEHEIPFLCIVVDGVSEQRFRGGERVRDRGQVFFYPALEPQSERFGRDGGRIFVVEMPQIDARLPDASRELIGPAALLARRLHFASRHAEDLEIDETTLAIVGALSNEPIDRRWIPIARDYLHAHFMRKLSLTAIAAAAGVHPVHLSRAFPRQFGMTLGDYVRALRVDYAARELATTERPIADIAHDAGFASQAHLTRQFRERMGVTPAAYRHAC